MFLNETMIWIWEQMAWGGREKFQLSFSWKINFLSNMHFWNDWIKKIVIIIECTHPSLYVCVCACINPSQNYLILCIHDDALAVRWNTKEYEIDCATVSKCFTLFALRWTCYAMKCLKFFCFKILLWQCKKKIFQIEK